MKILIDCSNLQVGGGIQVATSFINDLNSIENNDSFYVILSPQMQNYFFDKDFKKNINFITISRSNQRSVFKRGNFLKKIENNLNPDKVFCVFGPSYYKSSVEKTVGYAIPHYIYKDSPFFKNISLKSKIRLFLMEKVQMYLFNKNSDKLIFETFDAKKRFLQMSNFNQESTFVVNNTLNEIFLNKNKWINFNLDVKSGNNILCLSANYPHKNINIIPKVIDHLLFLKLNDFKFYLTVEKNETNFDSKYDKYICFLGKVEINQIPSLYEQMNILFMPTLLEVFSATYLEAMYMGLPIVTTDLSFARDICSNSAVFYDPLDAKDAANKLFNLIGNKLLQNELVQNGYENQKRFDNSLSRTMNFLKIIKS
ncbi:MAG: glycosyltransferase family 4 protein [Flavobacteriales bacterium]|nr:glycosyltransferase family 4 protein [Flavobacteriales bacterium]